MSDVTRHDALIDALGAELTPVRRLLPPWLRTLAWLAVVATIAVFLFARYGTHLLMRSWSMAPDLGLAGVGAIITAITASWAAFSLGIPGRNPAWAWLAVPGALLWIGASGLGCAREWLVPGLHYANVHEANHCLMFIVSFSLPLSGLLIWSLRRACPLRPVLTAVMVGLASAAASASLLEICHEFDAAATDLLMHALAVTLVVGINALMSGRLLGKA